MKAGIGYEPQVVGFTPRNSWLESEAVRCGVCSGLVVEFEELKQRCPLVARVLGRGDGSERGSRPIGEVAARPDHPIGSGGQSGCLHDRQLHLGDDDLIGSMEVGADLRSRKVA